MFFWDPLLLFPKSSPIPSQGWHTDSYSVKKVILYHKMIKNLKDIFLHIFSIFRYQVDFSKKPLLELWVLKQNFAKSSNMEKNWGEISLKFLITSRK